jgi:subtilisin family serine protease
MRRDMRDIADRPGAPRTSSTALDRVRLPRLMELTSGVPEVVVGLIDGPIARDHPDLAREQIRVLPGGAGDTCATPESFACRHGTLVAGLLHARRDSSFPGICPGCTLVSRSIFLEAPDAEVPNATVEELADAIIEVIGAGARVLNLSVGLAEQSIRAIQVIELVLGQAARHGVVVVVAAGNQGVLGSSAITRHPWVIPVVPCDSDGRVLASSNIGPSIGRHGLVAPGQDATSLAASGGHARFSGSSAAAPFVTGTVALLWSVFQRVSAAQLRLAMIGLGPRRSIIPPLLNASMAYDTMKATISEVNGYDRT